MNSYQIILKLIDAVDPSDTDNLDNIDTFVHILINDIAGNEKYIHPRQYTRSRDALKAIRPDGWEPSAYHPDCIIGCFHDGWYFNLKRLTQFEELRKTAYSMQHKTEELAELHAIIQAIAYERGL